MKKIYSSLLIASCILITLMSCDDFLTQDPDTALSTKQMFTSIERVEPLVSGLYVKWKSQKKDRVFLTAMMGNDETEESEAQIVWEVQQSSLDLYNKQLDATHTLLTQYWNNYWPVISGAAEIIAGIDNVDADVTVRDALKAEVCFLRAANYFDLVQYWGAVPMLDYEKQIELGNKRQPETVIYDYIIKDLTFAAQYLPETQTDKNRVTRITAKALLGKVYLHAPEETGVRNYEEAKKWFEAVIGTPGYGLVDDYADLFDYTKPNSKESIYEFQFSNEWPNQNQIQYQLGSRACGHEGTYWGGYECILPTKYCSQEVWEVGDLRKDVAIRDAVLFKEDGSPANYVLYPEELGPHIKKYEDPRASNNTWLSGKNVIYMRMADIILNYAECLNELGNTSAAVSEVNKVRTRAWGGTLPTDKAWSQGMSKEEFRVKIMDERMRELCFEGWRRMDLIRTGYFVDYIKERNQWAKKSGTIQSFHQKYPIPDMEIKNNDDISPEDQNPGYSKTKS